MFNAIAIFLGSFISSITLGLIVFFAFITSGPIDDAGAYAAFLVPFILVFFSFFFMLYYLSQQDCNAKLFDIIKNQSLKSLIFPALVILVGFCFLTFVTPLMIALIVFVLSISLLFTGTFIWYLCLSIANKKVKEHKKSLFCLAGMLSLFTVLYAAAFILPTKIAEDTCQLTSDASLPLAIKFVKKIGYDPVYMNKVGYKLDWCRYGFEYQSPKHFRLIIVDANGNVKLND